MAKPLDNDNKNPNNGKSPFEINTTNAILISNIILIVVILASMATVYTLLNNTIDKKIASITSEEDLGEGEDVPKIGAILNLDDFILNLADTAQRRYLKVAISLELSKTDEEIAKEGAVQKPSSGHGESPAETNAISAEMERYKPAISDAVISVLSNKTSDELSTPTGKEVAKEEIQEMVNGIFAGQREVIKVNFKQFIIQ